MTAETVIIRLLGQQAYQTCWQAMQNFTDSRQDHTPDEIWLLEHFPVFTQGQNGKPEHILDAGDIPIIQTDRGGQITYHGPGQLMIYTLINLKRKKLHVREFVSLLENTLISFLTERNIPAYAKCKAPGIYVQSAGVEKKMASIGLRIRKGFSYHGIAFNIAMDLAPFSRINPCGFSGLKMAQLSDYIAGVDFAETSQQLATYFTKSLGYTKATFSSHF